MQPDSGADYQIAGPVDDTGAQSPSHRLWRFLGFLLKFWWIPAVTLFIGAGSGAAYVYLKEPTFVSRASMWETLKLRLPEGALFSEDMQNFLGTQSELLKSGMLREQALARMRMMTNTVEIPRGEDGQPLGVGIRVSGNAKSSVFVIEPNSRHPSYTQNYLNALMQAYLDYKKNIRQVVSGDTLASISEQMQRWERDLKTEQEALTAFQRTNNLAILQEEGTIAGGYLARLKTQLSDLQLETRLLNAAVYETTQPQNDGTNAIENLPISSAAAAGSEPTANASLERQTAFREVQFLKMQRDKLAKFLRPKHPKMIKLEADIERAEKLQQIFVRQDREQLVTSRQANQLRIENVQTAIKEWETKVVEANNRISEAERLKLNVQRIQSVYDRLALLVQNVGISRNIDQESLAILEYASPVKRSYTSEKNGLVMSLFAGLAAGLGIVFLISVRDDRFATVTEVNSALGDAVVGMLPEVTQNGEANLPLLELNDPRHIYAESYRSLRSALMFQTTEGERSKVLLITSALPNEGKSTIAANLARTMALSGSRVLLVDADLRKGHLHRLLHLQSEPGLSELLCQTCAPEKVIQTDSLPNFTFISRGTCSGNPGDLFLGAGLDHILARWRRDYDYVLIDSSPLFAADDASCLAPKVDGTLFVVRRHHSSARAAREALELLARRQARVLGVIFNGADASARSYNYYKYADYHAPDKAETLKR
jgi:polysaccharide biosynthesis transport protein